MEEIEEAILTRTKMKLHYKIIVGIILFVPIAAYLDAVLIRGLSFYEYLYVCLFEMFIFIIGVLVGVKCFVREFEKEKKNE